MSPKRTPSLLPTTWRGRGRTRKERDGGRVSEAREGGRDHVAPRGWKKDREVAKGVRDLLTPSTASFAPRSIFALAQTFLATLLSRSERKGEKERQEAPRQHLGSNRQNNNTSTEAFPSRRGFALPARRPSERALRPRGFAVAHQVRHNSPPSRGSLCLRLFFARRSLARRSRC